MADLTKIEPEIIEVHLKNTSLILFPSNTDKTDKMTNIDITTKKLDMLIK